MLIPAPLHKGDTIGVMAPSSRTDTAAIEKACAVLTDAGFKTSIHPQCYKADHQSAGSAQDKAAALHDLFSDPDIKAIVTARGGNRAGAVLEHLDYDLIRQSPKILMGYSDVTALLNAVHARTGLVTYHGPVLNSFSGGLKENDRQQCLELLNGNNTTDLPLTGAHIHQEGGAEGPLLGGNLSVFVSLLGTPYMPDIDGAILFIEDCDDEISRFDRMMIQLRNAGIFDRIAGLIVGDFTNTIDSGPRYFGFSLEDIIRHATAGRKNIPILSGAPFGHGGRLATYPVGAPVRLDILNKDRPRLKMTGS